MLDALMIMVDALLIMLAALLIMSRERVGGNASRRSDQDHRARAC
jgi:hypothetical protein